MAFPLAFAGLPVYLHAPDFYAVTMGQPVALLGAVLLALRLVDALQDPLIGSLSDRFHQLRAGILLAGAVCLGLGLWMTFHPLQTAPMIWFAASVLICTTGFSIVSINFQAIGGLWRVRADDRTRITAWREAFGLAGLLTASVAPSALATVSGPASAFHWLTLAYVPVLILATWLLVRFMGRAPVAAPDRSSPAAGWLALLRDRWRLSFFSLVALSTFASAIPAVLVLFFVRDRLGAQSLTGIFLLIYFLAGVVSMPLWSALASRLGKFRTWRLSLLTAVITFSWAALLGEGDVVAYGIVCALSGLALGADLALPPAILADHIDADARQGDASRLFSIMAFLSKASLAAATGLTLPLLGLFGYQPGSALTPVLAIVISLTYAGIPCLLKLATLAGLSLLEKDLARNRSPV